MSIAQFIYLCMQCTKNQDLVPTHVQMPYQNVLGHVQTEMKHIHAHARSTIQPNVHFIKSETQRYMSWTWTL